MLCGGSRKRLRSYSAHTTTSSTLSSETRCGGGGGGGSSGSGSYSLATATVSVTVVSVLSSQMLIDLQGQVVVLDEAHNMEDAARDAASQTVTSAQMEEVSSELRDIRECV